MRNKMSKTDKVEITDDMSLEDGCYIKRHNETVDALDRIDCFSEYYTPNMMIYDGDETTRVLLELPSQVVRDAINICEEVNAKSKEQYDEEYGLTPFDVLQSAFDKTDVMHYPEKVVTEVMEEVHEYYNHTD